MSNRTQVFSSGGGTQSTAIAALIIEGRIPKPDLAIIVDTGRERTSTWEYYDLIVHPELAEVGVELHRVSKDELATVDLYSLKDRDLLIPAYTNINGSIGKLSTYCSTEWKRRVVMRWLRQQGVEQADMWLGISVDEAHRIRVSRDKWLQHKYPLIDMRLRRYQCVQIVESHGWPTPPRSSCWMCPNIGDAEWRDMKENYPDDFRKAVEIEKELQIEDPNIFLHFSGKNLDQVDFTEYQMSLFKDNSCNSGMCFV